MRTLVLLLLALAPRLATQATETRPNVLFIAVDDLNDWIGCLGGHPQTRTPNLDRLAASGMLFTNAYCAGASCNPSRTAVFTGRAPHQSGLYRNTQSMRALLPDDVLLPKHLSEHGYWSVGGGKLLHYIVDGPSWDDYFPSRERENPFPRTLYPSSRPVTLPREPWMYVEADWGPLDATLDEYGGDHLVAEWASKQLAEPHRLPFFLACGLYRPHEPWFVPRQYFDRFPLDSIELPAGVLDGDLDDVPEAGQRLARNRYLPHIREHDLWKSGVRAYLAAISFADDMVGRVLDALDQSPYRDTTIVVLWSDHGWHLGEKEHWQKFTGWRVCARVPLMIRVPAGLTAAVPLGTRPGSICAQPVNLLDLFPTLTELCDVPAKAGVDGHGLTSLLRDPAAEWPHLSLTQLDRPGDYALSGARMRYIHYEDGGEELYDIEADPHEWTNLAQDPSQAATLDAMRRAAPTDATPIAVDANSAGEPEGADLPWTPATADTPVPRSKPSAAWANVVLRNDREHTVRLSWIAPDGARRAFGEIQGGASRTLRTAAGHAWLVTDADGHELGWVVATGAAARATIPR